MKLPFLQRFRDQREADYRAQQEAGQRKELAQQRSMMGLRAADPGFVYQHGWTHFDCGACGDVIYDGRLIGAAETEELRRAHRAGCEAGPTP